MSPEEAYQLQLDLECKQMLPSGRLEEVPCDNPDGLAQISVVRFPIRRDGGEIHLRADADGLAADLIEGFSALRLLRASDDNLHAIGLRRHFSGRTGVFGSMPPEAACEGAVCEDGTCTLRVAGEQAAKAFSARESSRAAELSVDTDPRFRRPGYASRVASAWARDVLARGLTAFYSYDFSNAASERLAESLEVEILFEAGSFDPM